MTPSPFEIRHDKASGDLPQSWDVYLAGTDNCIAIVMDSKAMGEEFVRFLEQYPAMADIKRMAKLEVSG